MSVSAAVEVMLAPALVQLFPQAEPRIMVSARCVSDVIGVLNDRWPGMRDRICDSTPAIRQHINVYVNGKKATLDGATPNSAKVLIMTAVSGG